jgi:hypothetical protein
MKIRQIPIFFILCIRYIAVEITQEINERRTGNEVPRSWFRKIMF